MHSEFEKFVREYQNMVFSTAMRITCNEAESQDIAQQVFLQAYKHFDTLRNHENVGGWLRLSARNLSINHVQRYFKRWVFFDTASEIPTGVESAFQDNSDDSVMFDKVDIIKNLLSELPEKFRVPLVLFYYENLSYQEIAKSLKCSEGKIKTDIFRAKKTLSEMLVQSGVD